MADWISEAAADLDEQMLRNFQEYATILGETWTTFAGNHGQIVIIQSHILPAVTEHVNRAHKRWPYNENPEHYLARVQSCYNLDVIDRAFSDTLNQSYGDIYDLWLESMDLQHEHEYVVGIIGDSFEPHSTSANWRATQTGGRPVRR